MRVYALLLGILLTTGYGYAAQIAVSSLGAGRQPATEPATVVPATNSLDGVWYGGVLDPVTVESRSGGGRGRERILGPLAQRDHSRGGIVLRRARDRFRVARGPPNGAREGDEPSGSSAQPAQRVQSGRRRPGSLHWGDVDLPLQARRQT